MKKIILYLVFICLMVGTSYAADSKLSALTELAVAPAGTDQIYINDGGVSKRVTVDNLFKYATRIAGVDVSSSTGALYVSGGTVSALNEATLKSTFNIETGVDFQAWDTMLDEIAAITATPGADRLLGWDQSSTNAMWVTAGTGLSFTDTALNVSITSLDITLTDDYILVGNGSNIAAAVATADTEFIPVSWMDITDGGADPPESDYSTDSNSREIKIATFDGATDENLSFVWMVPENLTGTTIKFRWHGVVTNATGPSSEAISFQLSCISVADGEQLDFAAYGSAVAATESSVTEAQDDLITSAYSAAVTPTGLAAGEVVHCLLNRDADGNDTYAQDFGLIGIDIKYTYSLDGVTF